jgi:hypothetical protein
MQHWIIAAITMLVTGGAMSSAGGADKEPKPWRDLFDGRTLEGWKSTNFGGEGDVHVVDGTLEMDFGSPLSGITYVGDLPRMNYEIRLEAKKLEGVDFFCGVTFPVGNNYCSFIVGGWAGSVVGLSSIDGKDASENDTTRYLRFETGRWYRIRVRVTPRAIQSWIDDEQIVDQSTVGKNVGTRNEVVLSKPLGIAAYETRSALQKIQLRELAD